MGVFAGDDAVWEMIMNNSDSDNDGGDDNDDEDDQVRDCRQCV